MMSCFKIQHDEIVAYGDAIRRMYRTEELMLKSDFGRAQPDRVHEIARHAAGIPDHVGIGRTPLSEWEESTEETL
jgi:hypothetical protein